MKHRWTLIVSLILCLAAGCTGPGAASPPPAPPVPETRTIQTEPKLEPAPQPTEEAPPTEASETAAEIEPTSAPEPTEEAAPTAEETEPPEDPVMKKLSELTAEEKIAQLMIVTPEALTQIDGPVDQAGDTTRQAFAALPAGGIIYMGQNLLAPEQTRTMLAAMEQISLDRIGLPPFLCVDEEGGTVARISGTGRFGVPAIPDMAEIGAAGDPEQALAAGRTIGAYLKDLGFNLDFAPVADVWTEPANQVVRRRSFGSDPNLVAELAAACARGLTEEGILPCWKHFPGHGATAEDSHLGFAVSPRDPDELNAAELVPFRKAAEEGAPLIMAGHISVPAVTGDDTPATLSCALVTGLLRQELGYAGLIVTDALNMGAIADHYGEEEAAVLALAAGCDLLLMPDHPQRCMKAILKALEQGELNWDEIDRSVERILRLKLELNKP